MQSHNTFDEFINIRLGILNCSMYFLWCTYVFSYLFVGLRPDLISFNSLLGTLEKAELDK